MNCSYFPFVFTIWRKFPIGGNKSSSLFTNNDHLFKEKEKWSQSFCSSLLSSSFEVKNFSQNKLKNFLKKVPLQSLKSGSKIKNVSASILKNECAFTLLEKQQSKSDKKTIAFFSNFIENFVGALNFFDGKDPPTTIYEKHVAIQIYYQFFTIPIVVAGILQPLILITWKVYLVTAAIFVIAGAGLYIYTNWFRAFPSEIPYCEEIKKSADIEFPQAIHGLEKETESLISQLSVEKKKNSSTPVLLLADSGGGKTTLVYKLYQKIREKKVPKSLENKKIFVIKGGELIAKSAFGIGDKLKAIQQKLMGFEKETIIFFDEIHAAVQDPASFELVKSFLRTPSLQFIAATTLTEFEEIKKKDKDGSFCRPLSYLKVQPYTKEQLQIILQKMIDPFLQELFDSNALVNQIIDQTDSSPSKLAQPAKAIKLLQSTLCSLRKKLFSSAKQKELASAYAQLERLKEVYLSSYPCAKSEEIHKLQNKITQLELKAKEEKKELLLMKKIWQLKQMQKKNLLHLSSTLQQKAQKKLSLKKEEEKLYLFTKYYFFPALEQALQKMKEKRKQRHSFSLSDDFVKKIYEKKFVSQKSMAAK